jgi:hypothetical protein
MCMHQPQMKWWLKGQFVWRITAGVPSFPYVKVTVKQSHYGTGQALRVLSGWGSQILRQSTHEFGKVVSPTHRPPLPQEILLVLISIRGWVGPRAIMRPKGTYQFKKSSDTIGNRTHTLPQPPCHCMPNFCMYYMKILLGCYKTKLGREDEVQVNFCKSSCNLHSSNT